MLDERDGDERTVPAAVFSTTIFCLAIYLSGEPSVRATQQRPALMGLVLVTMAVSCGAGEHVVSSHHSLGGFI